MHVYITTHFGAKALFKQFIHRSVKRMQDGVQEEVLQVEEESSWELHSQGYSEFCTESEESSSEELEL